MRINKNSYKIVLALLSMTTACNAGLTDKHNVKYGGQYVAGINQEVNLISPISAFVHGYTGNEGNGQATMLEIENRLFQSGNGYIQPIIPNDRKNSASLSIEAQGNFLYEDLKEFLLKNKELYVSLYGGKVPVDLLAFSQGFQVSLNTITMFLNDLDFDWVDFRLIGASPVLNGVHPLDILYGDLIIDGLFLLNGPVKNIMRNIKESIISPIWNMIGRKVGQSGLTGMNAGECRKRATIFRESLSRKNKELRKTVFIIHSESENASTTFPPKFLGSVGKKLLAQYLHKVTYFFAGKHDGLLSHSNQTGNFYEADKKVLDGNHMDIHTKRKSNENRNVEYLLSTDGNVYPFYKISDKAHYLKWGYTEVGTADLIAKEYWEWCNDKNNEEHID